MITRSDPLRDALSLRRAMDQLFEQSFVQPGLLPRTPAQMAPMADRDVGRLVLLEQEFLLATRDARGARHHDPVFGAVMVQLQ